MSVRPFDWRDLPRLYRYRHDSVILDSALLCTRGPHMVPGALVSYLAPGMGIVTCVGNGESGRRKSVIGQFIHTNGSQFAHLTFLTPRSLLDTRQVSALLDYMVALSGVRGAMRLLADVDEGSEAFEALRRDGFSAFSRQRIWQLDTHRKVQAPSGGWRAARNEDLHAVKTLYHNVVPGLVQQVEPFLYERLRGVVYYQQDDLLAYVDIKKGHRGIWVQPYFHPEMDDLLERMVDLLDHIPNRSSQPIYICVRSYQTWLETQIEALGGLAGPQQALMVRHLAVWNKAESPFALPALEGGSAEVSAPIVRTESNNY